MSNHPSPLLTDLYQLTMLQAYVEAGADEVVTDLAELVP